MKKIVTLILASILLTSCSNTTYKKIDEKQPFIASINIKDTSLTFLTEQYAKLAYWDLDIPFMGGLLLSNRDSYFSMEKIWIPLKYILCQKENDWIAGK